jgi:hypothetical protein
MLQLSDNPQETLTAKVWEQWQKTGATTRPHSLTWIELNNLTGYFLKTCTAKKLDYQAYDFLSILDSKLNYYENQSAIDEAIAGPLSEDEAYQRYEADMNQQTLKEEMQQINDTQAAAINKIEQTPNLPQLVEALNQSQSFQSLGKALNLIVNPPPKPIKTMTNDGNPDKPAHYTYHGQGAEYCKYCGNKIDAGTIKCPNCGAPIKEEENNKTIYDRIPECFKPKKPIKLLDALAAIMLTTIWLSVTYAALTSGSITWITVVAIAFWWILYVVVFRIVVGGILD